MNIFTENNPLGVLKYINDNGYLAYIVGGYCRDLYLGIESYDVDICTNCLDFSDLFEGYKKNKYGCVNFESGDYHYQITTFRIEGDYDDYRHPSSVNYVDNLKSDLLRRDFIINTLCLDYLGNYVDLLGAIKDINQKKICSVSNVGEDALRILRAIRFASVYDFNLSAELLSDIIKYKNNLSNLSKDVIFKELDIIFEYEWGFNFLKKYKLCECLGLDLDFAFVSKVGIWSQQNGFNYSKKLSNKIEIINSLKSGVGRFDVYKYGYDLCYDASILFGYDVIDDFYIDICFNIHYVVSFGFSYKQSSAIYNVILKKIVNLEIENNIDNIYLYIINNYMV